MAVERGCGVRVKGGLYLECPLSPYGMPLEEFLVDPPVPIDVQSVGVTPIGVKLVERKGVWHVMDWVGSSFYNNVADYVEEVRRFGLSRRVAQTLDFKKLTSQSRILLLHARAYIHNFDEYAKYEPDVEELEGLVPYPRCPKKLAEHTRPNMDTMCARLWYQDVEGGEEDKKGTDENAARIRVVTKKMPSFEYHGLVKPASVKPDYKVAVFASFPITNIAVVRDIEGGTHNRSLALAQEARIPVSLVEE